MISGKYKEFYNKINKFIPKERLLHDALSTLAFGTDASFYRLIPKLVIRANNTEEIICILRYANELSLPVTFRAAGTSLSGQALSDSILVIASHGFTKYKIYDKADKIELEPGIRGAIANRYLAPFGRKIGPDPASIDSAMIGGIAANNASGMCCGTSENSYKTIADIKIILSDGCVLDTADKDSRANFENSHKEVLVKLEEIALEINSNTTLKERIKKKYKIKNTTGYSLNAFTDYSNGFDILKHLIIGSEGTLAFISSITYNTVIEHKHKSLALIIYSDIKEACSAVQVLKQQAVSAVELIDRAGIRSVDSAPGVPKYLKTLSNNACALLVETRAACPKLLEEQVNSIKDSIKDFKTELHYSFTTDAKEQAILWKIRKETLPTVAGMRKSGTTSIIEDICFPINQLADAVLDLRKVFDTNAYSDAVIFGHALEGNLHFMFNQDFGSESEVERYSKFMDDIADLVVSKYDGSLKAEHGTGRNMAPYVEKEWGETAYKLMQRVKNIFDPKGILNPGVILNSNHKAHIQNLKPCPSSKETIDKCMECGFCEGTCVAEGLTLSPRQRVAAYREIERLKSSGQAPHIAAEMQARYKYWAMDTCATDSLCAIKCPVKVDAGKLIKELRHSEHSIKAEERASSIAINMDKVTAFMRTGLKLAYNARIVIGKECFGTMASLARTASFGAIPKWNKYFPNSAHKIKIDDTQTIDNKNTVVYFPSCITRSMGLSKSYSKELEISQLTEKLLNKAGYKVVYPKNLDKLCCGMAFSSKGYVDAGNKASKQLEKELTIASNNGLYPILCDMSPCLYTMHVNMDESLKLYEPAEFITKYIVPKLKINKLDKKVAVFAVCSAKKLGVDNMLYDLAKLCAKEVVIIDSNCCGFAGDRGFLVPELNAHGLRHIKEQVNSDQNLCSEGYATSRTCEIGLSYHSGITFKSILYLIDQASSPL